MDSIPCNVDVYRCQKDEELRLMGAYFPGAENCGDFDSQAA
jgi:hypothetical protein